MSDVKFENHKKVLEEDFKSILRKEKIVQLKISRFFRLEKAWIRDISHQIMPHKRSFVHDDRKELRNELFTYLNKKIKENSMTRWKEQKC